MRNALIVAITLIGGGLLAHLLLADPGYVAMRGGRWLFETTVPVFVLMLTAVVLLSWLIARAATARRRFAHVRAQRRKRRAREDTGHGTLALAAGQWQRAEELLTRAAPNADSPVANYLVAARAADLQDAVQRRDALLARAQEIDPGQRAAVLVTLAEMQMRRGQDLAALQTLQQLDASGDLNARGLELTARLYRKLGRSAELLALEPRLRSTKELSEKTVSEWLAQASIDELRSAGQARDAAALDRARGRLPRSVRRLPQSMIAYARAALACGEQAAAEKALREVLDEAYDEAAARLYGDLVLPDPLLPLERLEGWLRKRPQDPELLSSAGKLCLRAELIGKARSYLETSLALRPQSDTALLLADLYEQLGERERATQLMRDVLTRTAGQRTVLPRVRVRR
jgi:HemY protein